MGGGPRVSLKADWYYCRTGPEGTWESGPPLGAGEVLDLPEIGIAIPVDELDERVSFAG